MNQKPYPKSVVIEENALNQIAYADVGNRIIAAEEFSLNALGLRSIRVGDSLYVLNQKSIENSRLLVIDAQECNIFDFDGDSYEFLDRIIKLALSRFSQHVSISPKWAPYSDGGSKGSIFANTAARGNEYRIYYDERFNDTRHLFVYSLQRGKPDFSRVEANKRVFSRSISAYEDALLEFIDRSERVATSSGDNVVHIDPLGADLAHGWTLDEWLNTYLTKQQREFVEKSHNQSVRLRGAAGTGKTLSLVVKFLNDLRLFEQEKQNRHLCFVTHSQVTKELVLSIIGQLDPQMTIIRGDHASGKVRTVYEICHDLMNSREQSVSPVDVDAYEGRLMQKEIIKSILEDCRNTLDAQFGDQCIPEFRTKLQSKSDSEKNRFVEEIYNEFSSIFDSEGIRPGTDNARRYIDRPKAEWKTEPREIGDRKVLMELYRRYRNVLHDMRVISVDQLVADAVGFLASNTWDNLVNRSGFDALYVDEAHLFSTLERQVLRPLLRHNNDGKWANPMFVAYDFKQVTRDGLESIVPSFRSTAAWMGSANRNSDRVDLEEVFRFTPQIASLISDLAMTYVDTDLLDEIDKSTGESGEAEGDRPTIQIFESNQALYQKIFSAAAARAKKMKSGRKVCIICLDDTLYKVYRQAGMYSNDLVCIEGREDIAKLRYAGRKFILSTPEYVSGLQFEVVFLLHADAGVLDNDELGPRKKRLNVRRLYLASTRASNELHIACSNELGGRSRIFDHALSSGSLKLISKTNQS